jgi:protein-disulfide isomerase
VQPVVHRLVENYGDRIKLVYRHFPLPSHQFALIAADAAEAAGEQGKFWEMADRLFVDQARLSEPMIYETAANLGLDMNRFRESVTQRRHARVIDDDTAEALRRNVRGTPTFFIGRNQLRATLKYEDFEKAVQAELQRIESGTK